MQTDPAMQDPAEGSFAPKVDENSPPNSRLFVLCPRSMNDDELLARFTPYGNVDSCRVILDRVTKAPKGFGYVKYDKASSAAFAIEALDHKSSDDPSRPWRVMVAEEKGHGGDSRHDEMEAAAPEDTPPRSRLFVYCPKDMEEAQLTAHFEVYGDLDYCRIVKEKGTQVSKGMAYVKFSKSSTASLALEALFESNKDTAEPVLKAQIAQPRQKRGPGNDMGMRGSSLYGGYGGPPAGAPPPGAYGGGREYGGGRAHGHMGGGMAPPHHGSAVPSVAVTRLFVVCHRSITRDQLVPLFSRFPDMEYCDLKTDRDSGDSKGFAYIKYKSQTAAQTAIAELNGYSFPLETGGTTEIRVMKAEPHKVGDKGGPRTLEDSFSQMMKGGVYQPGHPQAHQQHQHQHQHQYQSGAKQPLLGFDFPSVAQNPPFSPFAMNPLVQTHSWSPGGGGANMAFNPQQPPQQPSPQQNAGHSRDRGDPDFPPNSRLFIICGTKTTPEYVLYEKFSRYGQLEYVQMIPGKKCGYVKFANAASAAWAMQEMNGQIFNGQSIKVMVAEKAQDPGRKRQKLVS